MKKIMEQMAEELSAAFEKAGYDPSYGKVTVSNRPDLCEYQCNGAMAGAKTYHKAPFMIADDVVAQLSDSQIFSRAEVVKPGFINLDVKTEFVAEYMNKMAEDEKLSVETAKNPKTIIIDYGGAKRCQTPSRRTSPFCDHRREHQAYRTFCRTQGDRRCASWRLGPSDGTDHHRAETPETGAGIF